jgi:hypothetical protein
MPVLESNRMWWFSAVCRQSPFAGRSVLTASVLTEPAMDAFDMPETKKLIEMCPLPYAGHEV